jgi:hypothetical protein
MLNVAPFFKSSVTDFKISSPAQRCAGCILAQYLKSAPQHSDVLVASWHNI